MSSIDKRELREAAEKATPGPWEYYPGNTSIEYNVDSMVEDQGSIVYVDSGDFTQKQTDLNGAFIAAANPATVLALLDELERNQQYIKSRDQENEEIALTVGKLRVELEAANKRIAELEAEPVSQAYNLAELIEGMEVSIDVSTCDADLGNRYFGTVTEALELDTAKNGYILLVQDAEPNFDVNGSSPVTPDSWISCSERMPDKLIPVMVMYEDGEMWSAMWNGNRWDDGTEYTDPHSVTHWREMPAAPQQEVNRG